ncbi:hypothetical protein MTO96_019875 [Rhipicephalus appendiculatus]
MATVGIACTTPSSQNQFSFFVTRLRTPDDDGGRLAASAAGGAPPKSTSERARKPHPPVALSAHGCTHAHGGAPHDEMRRRRPQQPRRCCCVAAGSQRDRGKPWADAVNFQYFQNRRARAPTGPSAFAASSRLSTTTETGEDNSGTWRGKRALRVTPRGASRRVPSTPDEP